MRWLPDGCSYQVARSKNQLAPWIVSQFPAHEVFVDVFGGSAAITLAKPPSTVEIYNDADESLVNFFRVVRDPATFERLQLRLSLTPYSRAETWWAARL